MELKISLIQDQQIVLIKTSGVADTASTNEFVANVSKSMMEYKATKCLIDHRGISVVSGSTLEIYQRSKEISKLNIPSGIKIAAIILPAHKEHFGFLETVCVNRGFKYRLFNDQESAMKWLTD